MGSGILLRSWTAACGGKWTRQAWSLSIPVHSHCLSYLNGLKNKTVIFLLQSTLSPTVCFHFSDCYLCKGLVGTKSFTYLNVQINLLWTSRDTIFPSTVGISFWPGLCHLSISVFIFKILSILAILLRSIPCLLRIPKTLKACIDLSTPSI